MPSQNEFKIKFGGQLHQIDAQTFIGSLVNVSTVIEEVNQELATGKKIEIKIKANEPGSFITSLELQEVVDVAQRLFTADNVHILADIIVVMGGLYKLKKHLGNKTPKSVKEEGDRIRIENEKGVINIFDNRTYGIYNRNQIANDAISNNFSTLENDPSVENFEIIDSKNRQIFIANKEDFEGLAIKSEVADEKKRAQIVMADIVIHKIVWEEKYKWEFYYRGNKVSANIIDEDFFRRIEEGESFSKGDSLKVDLQINQIFDESVNIYVNHSYQINKVYKHIPRGKQLKIEDINNLEK